MELGAGGVSGAPPRAGAGMVPGHLVPSTVRCVLHQPSLERSRICPPLVCKLLQSAGSLTGQGKHDQTLSCLISHFFPVLEKRSGCHGGGGRRMLGWVQALFMKDE